MLLNWSPKKANDFHTHKLKWKLWGVSAAFVQRYPSRCVLGCVCFLLLIVRTCLCGNNSHKTTRTTVWITGCNQSRYISRKSAQQGWFLWSPWANPGKDKQEFSGGKFKFNTWLKYFCEENFIAMGSKAQKCWKQLSDVSSPTLHSDGLIWALGNNIHWRPHVRTAFVQAKNWPYKRDVLTSKHFL